MIKFSCPHCGKSINTPDQYAGKRGKCPGCQQSIPIPAPSATDVPVAKTKSSQAAIQAQPPAEEEILDAQPVEEEEQKPRRRRRRRSEDDFDYDEDRPERYTKDSGTPIGRTGYAVCYNCGADRASRVGWTFWGGIIGPAIISHVKCGRCGTTYNGKSGKSNTTAIIIYFVVTFIIFGGLAVCAGIFAASK
jgi:DNA-directed RNA polymerase subunit M/transcription elongation factor TFIIS